MSALPGLNGPADARLDPNFYALLGSRVVRFVLKPDVDLNPWIDEAHGRGLSMLGVIANESMGGMTSVGAARFYRERYGDTLEYLQVGNEPDHVSPSSWTMSPQVLNHFMAVFSVEFPDTPIICGGMADGRPEYLDELDPDLYDIVGVQCYGQRPNDSEDWSETPGNFGNVQRLLPLYVQHSGGKPVAVTEIGLSTKEVSRAFQARYVGSMLTTLMSLPYCVLAIIFCADDAMVPEFGLFDENGNPKPSAAAFMRAAGPIVKPEPEPEPILMALPIPIYRQMWQAHMPTASFQETWGVEKFWMEQDRWKKLGAVTSMTEYRKGKEAWRTFVGGVIHWNDDTGGELIA